MKMKRSLMASSLPVGLLMLLSGLAKFFEPFRTNIREQIRLAQLPLEELSPIAAQAGEIFVGLVLLSLPLLWSRAPAFAARVLRAADLMVVGLMSVAMVVHLHPDVPAQILPFESKPPVLTVVTLLVVGLNLYLVRRRSAE